MSAIAVGVVGLSCLLLAFLTGIEVCWAMGIIGFIGFAYIKGFTVATNLMAKDMLEVLTSYSFTVVPLFLFMGQLAYNGGIANKIYDASHKFLGHVPGGLALATVAGATLFKAICGSGTATTATFASIAVPEMDRYGYGKKLSTGIVASVGTLGNILPPSAALIIFGVITQQSIGKLFIAGIIPGLMIAFFFAVIIYLWCRLNPAIGPRCEKFSWNERMRSLPAIIWPVLVFIVVIGGLLAGYFTPTEAGSIGTSAVLLLCVFKGDMNLKSFMSSVSQALRSSCMVLMLLAGSAILGHFIAVTRIPMIAAEWLVGLPLPPLVIMVIIGLVYLIGGSFIDDLAFMVLATPIFFPAAQRLGYDPLWFAMIIMITIMIGVVIPPVAINVFIVKNVTRTPFSVIYSGVYPFLIALVVAAVILFMFPGIVTFLPNKWM